MNGLPVADDFIKEIDDCINETKTNHEERVSYMTYEMKMQEAHDDGRAEGRTEGLLEAARSLMAAQNLTAQEAMDTLNLPEETKKTLLPQI